LITLQRHTTHDLTMPNNLAPDEAEWINSLAALSRGDRVDTRWEARLLPAPYHGDDGSPIYLVGPARLNLDGRAVDFDFYVAHELRTAKLDPSHDGVPTGQVRVIPGPDDWSTLWRPGAEEMAEIRQAIGGDLPTADPAVEPPQAPS
jgi:hypothetical protein